VDDGLAGKEVTDILLNKALSQFNLKNYEACLQTIQILDASFLPDTTAPEFAQELLIKLNALTIQYA
jgi:hypothetical protein